MAAMSRCPIPTSRDASAFALYMDGIYGPVGSPEAERACIAQLMPERLSDQYCLRSERALRCLSFEGSEQIWT